MGSVSRMLRALRLATLGLLLAGVPALAATPPLNPPDNIPLGPLPAACGSAPARADCERAVIAKLDGARAKLGLPPYLLPADFVRLLPPRQWLILGDLDRLAYGRPPITGLSRALNGVARQGALAMTDPDPGPLLSSLHTAEALGYASNWAGGQANALLAYYGWMYDDGYGSPNLDCRTPASPGCWGHRQDVLSFKGGAIAMGGAAVRSSYALTLVDTSAPAFPYTYTWARAQADGAGRGSGG